jgi:hypothetical protein
MERTSAHVKAGSLEFNVTGKGKRTVCTFAVHDCGIE